VSVSVQAIQEDCERIGALVTLRDLDSLESINTQLQVSERLAALGRITAGVAHEVKNPLNSMRLWLENLKESLPAEQDGASQQAVQVLDKEIDRLDAVVKRFLDFTRPMDIRLEATQLAELLKEGWKWRSRSFRNPNIQLAQLLPIDVPEVYVDRALLKRAVLNLVLNAAEAMPGGGQLRLVLSRRGEWRKFPWAIPGKAFHWKTGRNFPIVFHHASGRQRHRTREYVSNCAASERFDRLYIGGRPGARRSESNCHSRPKHDGKPQPGPLWCCRDSLPRSMIVLLCCARRRVGRLQHEETAAYSVGYGRAGGGL